MDLLKELLIWLFVPEDNYFNNLANEFVVAFNEKIPYQDYINTLESMQNIEVDSITESIDLDNYYISDSLTISQDKFIDFSIFEKYKNVWYTWIRVVIYIMLIIYNINQVIVLFRGASAVSGAGISLANNNTTSNK